jgi:2Fe-2S ferredoxin
MSRVQYVAANEQVTELDVDEGTSIMQAALIKGLPGINADCGGACQCATCHIYVDEAWAFQLPAMGETEDAMLDCTAEPRQSSSRRACCLPMSAALDGLRVRGPARQV